MEDYRAYLIGPDGLSRIDLLCEDETQQWSRPDNSPMIVQSNSGRVTERSRNFRRISNLFELMDYFSAEVSLIGRYAGGHQAIFQRRHRYRPDTSTPVGIFQL
jgi:hypothetical protein